MEHIENPEENDPSGTEFKKYVLIRIIIGICIFVGVVWGAYVMFGYFGGSSDRPVLPKTHEEKVAKTHEKLTETHGQSEALHVKTAAEEGHAPRESAVAKKKTAKAETHGESTGPAAEADAPATTSHGPVASTHAPPKIQPKGVAFIDALIAPIDYELRDRWYGWRPNDIIDVTDNVNQFQLGVLEVTRRTTVELTERIARTGSTATIDPNLERAMNWFMIKAERYWLPSPESKYRDGVEELKAYRTRLEKGQAPFYTRPDNLIPLLEAFEDLLGSCDENLVKATEEDGDTVSHFKADDYFYYTKGVASAMYPILEAVMVDFQTALVNRHGIELLHHAIESLHRGMQIEPWFITEAGLSGILANHRANMAAPISHARFYISVLITTLST